MWEFFLRQNRFTYLLMVALVALGIYSVITIPKESTPEIIVPVGVVTTILPGAPALDIETLITNEIERGLAGGLDDVSDITSVSQEGVSSITVEFDASADIDTAIQDLKDKVDTITPNLPSDAEDPSVIQIDFVNQPIMVVSIAGDLTDGEFTDLATALEAELESVSGVSSADPVGIREREVTIMIDPAALARFSLTITDVINGLRNANTTFPIGQIVNNGISYNIAFEGDIDGTEEIASIPVAVRGGQPVYVRDLGTVTTGLASAATLSRLSIDSEPSAKAITFNVFKQSGGDITRIAAATRAKLETLKADGNILHGLSTYVVSDAGADISKDLGNLITSGIQTVLLVILVLVVTIGWREGLLAGLTIPLSFTIGFIGLYFSDNTINFISLFALILGIGVLVDSGIVMVEGINKEMKANPNIDKREAALRGVRLYASPLISGTLTTVAMFVGLFIVSGITGQFIAGIPFTLIFVLFASIFVALAFVPVLAAHFLRRRNSSKVEALQVEYQHRVETWYANKLRSFLRSRRQKQVFIGGLILSFFLSIALIPLGLVKVVFFEQSDVPSIFVDIEMPEGTIKEETDKATRQVEEILYNDSDMIEAYAVTVGSGNAFTGGGNNQKAASFTINLRDDRPLSSTEYINRLRADIPAIPHAVITVSEPNNGPPTGSPVGIRLLGNDLEKLAEATTKVAQYVETIPGTANVETSNTNNNTEYVFTLDKDRTAALGLSPLTVSQTLRSAVFGAEATTLTTLTDDIPVTVRLNLTGATNPELQTINHITLGTLENVTLTTPTGQVVPLATLVTTSLREANTAIRHEDQMRVMTIGADTTPEGNVIEINQQVRTKLAESGFLPSGVTFQIGGEAEESNQAFIELFLALIVGLVLMVAVLVLEFNSFRYTLYVLSIVPFSLIGILVGLAITGSALSFPSIMGFIALTGIVVNNSILLIDIMNHNRRHGSEQSMESIVVDSATSRLRPIMLTSITTVVGMIPLLTSDPIWVPLATAIIFGLSFSVLITLLLVPIIYLKYPGKLRN
jgi:multidrug efflux pump subunit AcrB